MTEERRKEIALLLIEARIAERGIPGVNELGRDVGNAAKAIGIETHELMAFYQTFVPKVLGKIFRYNRVSVIMGDAFVTESHSKD